ncbi:DNA-binding transcriptional regulator, AcrR family [Amycolatopsis arida]|uniref:DNA-binding transcriptional regulator, AcrR family n=1 Tax=Amycolatopsis arida TaxID=587909 RepID=A0A1I5Q2N6_9PSEU|nr:TetR/AcrR family transcriptional regulator [Amycolatopsis arida]TDX98700.1 AcrR family transcriptional regulator [Amycolatopsis arida]SFP40618.1 DNA-binding transcriptional regulator, AcrR family [Amycolatopsis arida]
MAGRRGDTRERIQRVALELFVEQGYEKTSLREIAERLGVTKAALYYHFRTKEDIVHSLVADLSAALDELLEWAGERPRAREEVLRRFAALVDQRFGPVMEFVQQNMPAMRELGLKHTLGEKLAELFQLICADDEDPATQLRARLALVALILGANPMFSSGRVAPPPRDVALEVALELAVPRRSGGSAT